MQYVVRGLIYAFMHRFIVVVVVVIVAIVAAAETRNSIRLYILSVRFISVMEYQYEKQNVNIEIKNEKKKLNDQNQYLDVTKAHTKIH